jgi:hypothetical protein
VINEDGIIRGNPCRITVKAGDGGVRRGGTGELSARHWHGEPMEIK